MFEDFVDGPLRPVAIPVETLHVETRNRGRSDVEGVDESFDRNGFTISRHTVEDYAPLPRDSKLLVEKLIIEEPLHVRDEVVFHSRIKDDIFPRRIFDGFP